MKESAYCKMFVPMINQNQFNFIEFGLVFLNKNFDGNFLKIRP